MESTDPRQLRAGLLARGLLTSAVPLLLLDGDSRILFAGAGASQLLGHSADALLGQALTGFLATDKGLPSACPAEADGGVHVQELLLRTAGGASIPVEITCTDYSDADGERVRLVFLYDLSHIKSAEQDRLARLGKLSMLNQVSDMLYGARMTLDQILQAVLHCVTAEQGLRFNRAFLLLIDEAKSTLKGEIAIGPSNAEEAGRIWQDLGDQVNDLSALMTRYDRSLKQTDVTVNELVKTMAVPVGESEHILIRSMNERQAFRVVASDVQYPGVDGLRHWLGTTAFAVAPMSTRRGPLGVIVADNAISGREISDLDLEFLQLLANESANAIENTRLYEELQNRLADLRKAAQRQKEDQKQLLRMERLSIMGETAAVVAHELRNPLVAIGGFARALHRSLAETDPHREYARIITEEVARLERIIHDLLDFIRPKKILRKSVVVDELITDTVKMYDRKMVEQGIELILSLRAPGAKARINPSEIQQVVQNLVVNAMQAMDKGGRLEILTQDQPAGVTVEVRDTGPGVPPELRAKLFTPFFSTKASGSGLGLTISSQIIKGHGGTLTCRSAEGGGAAFSFTLPRPKLRPPETA